MDQKTDRQFTPPEADQSPPTNHPMYIKYRIVIALLIFIVALLIGYLVFQNWATQDNQPPSMNPTTPTIQEQQDGQINTQASEDQSQPHLFWKDLVLPYESSWEPYFNPMEEIYRPQEVYFAYKSNPVESVPLTCFNNDGCDLFPMKLNLEFGSPTQFDAQNLSPTSLQGYNAQTGFLNDLSHQTVIFIDDVPEYVMSITATVTPGNEDMLQEYVENLSQIVINDQPPYDPNELVTTALYEIPPQHEIGIIPLLSLETLLADPGSTERYSYILYRYPESVGEGEIVTQAGRRFILSDNTSLEPGIYGTPQITLDLKKANQLLPFVQDKKYCEQDSDCTARISGCTQGVYNYFTYQHFGPSGCGALYYEGLNESRQELQSKLECQRLQVNYGTPRCVNNTCVGEDPQPACL